MCLKLPVGLSASPEVPLAFLCLVKPIPGFSGLGIQAGIVIEQAVELLKHFDASVGRSN